MYRIKIDNNFYTFNKKYTIIQACFIVGIEIPRFCYHDKLSIAGNCRMCLVEISKSPKPVASCALSIMDGMEIYTRTALIKKAREGVLEFLLSNHPLDCPICDQGGECDLQDQSLVFGSDRGRFFEYKRAVEDKNCGPFVKTLMTRCIHCTRCVRFSTEIAGINDFGVIGRGSKMEISTYVNKVLISEISSNIIDLCPVGALTSKPFAYTVRSWELLNEISIDFSDSLNSSLRVEYFNEEIKRVLPLINININENWLSDVGRFNYDGLKNQRLLYPLVKFNNKFIIVNWSYTVNLLRFMFLKSGFFDKNSNFKISSFLGNYIDLKSSFVLKEFLSKFNSFMDVSVMPENKYNSNLDFHNKYLLSTNIYYENLESIILIGMNPRFEIPLMNYKLKKMTKKSKVTFFTICNIKNYNFNVKQLGNNPKILFKIILGQHWVCNFLIKSTKFIFLIGSSLYISYHINNMFKYFNLLNILLKTTFEYYIIPFLFNETNLNFVGFLKNNICSVYKKNYLFMYNYDLLNINQSVNYDYKVYLGFIGDKGALYSDLILPTTSYVEQNGFSLNLQGYLQKYKKIFFEKNEIFEDWQILIFLLHSCWYFMDYRSFQYNFLLKSILYYTNFECYLDCAIKSYFLKKIKFKRKKKMVILKKGFFNSVLISNLSNRFNIVDRYSLNIKKGFHNFKYKYKFNF